MGIAVFALLVLAIDAVFITAHRGARTAELAADVNQNARIAADRLTREVREAGVSNNDIRVDATSDGDDAVIFKTARPAGNPNVFCVNVGTVTEALYSAQCNYYAGGPPTAGVTDYAPVWQRFIGYYRNAEGELIRYVGTLTTPTAALPAPLPVPGGATEAMIATAVRRFDLALTQSCSDRTGTLAVTLEAEGTEVVQGSNVPPQRTTLEASLLLRNTFGSCP